MADRDEYISELGWIVTRDVRQPFVWDENVQMFSMDAYHTICKYRGASRPFIRFILHLAGYGNPELLTRMANMSYYICAAYCCKLKYLFFEFF